jgi:hypothetical protein
MKFEIRKPSIKTRIGAHTSVKRVIRYRAGIKAHSSGSLEITINCK